MNFKDSRGNECVFISAGEVQALASLGELIHSHPILLTIGLSKIRIFFKKMLIFHIKLISYKYFSFLAN